MKKVYLYMLQPEKMQKDKFNRMAKELGIKCKLIKTEIRSEITLNDIPVEGPRSKTRIIFKDQEKPIMMHLGL